MDAIAGTAGNDTVTGLWGNEVVGGALVSAATLSTLDAIDGSAGLNVLNVNIQDGTSKLTSVNTTNVQTVNVKSIGAATVDSTSGFTGVTALNLTQAAGNAAVTAATTTDLSVAGVLAGTTTVDGGKNITVTDTTAAKDIVIGATTVNAGTITVTDSKVGAADIKIDGGTAVTVTATGSTGAGKVITVGNGGATTDLPSGVVSVTSAHTGVAATDVAMSAITVKGGSTVTVTQTSDTAKVAADTTGATLTQGAVTVVGGNTTTAVTVAQAKSVAETPAVLAVAGTTETNSVKFTALTIGQTITLGGLTFTASAALTAAQAAAAFANLAVGTLPVAGDTQSGGAASKGTYTGVFTGWTSGAVSTDTVVFTSTADGAVANLVNAGSGTVTITATDGTAATDAEAGVLGVITGKVLIDDNATASITTVSVDGYGDASSIGSTGTLSKLATLTLANSGGATAGATTGSMTVDAAGVSSLNVSVNKIKGAVSLDGAADNALKTLNLTATGSDSSFALTAAAVETLTIAGDKKATLSTGTFTALKSITVSGSASAVFDGDEADTLTSVNTSTTTGAVTATINGTKATYTGGAGVDTVTLATGIALTKAIDLGAGNDTLSFAALNVTGSTAAVAGGDGNDTLSMAAATGATLDNAKQTFYTGFEYLTVNDAGAGETLDLANLGFTTQVTTNGGTITLDKLANNGTVILNAATTATTVQITDAADVTKGLADVLNVTTNVVSADLNFGTLTAANIETVSINADDTKLDDDSNGTNDPVETATLTLVATNATKIVVTGDSNLTLINAGNTAVTAIDASAMTGDLIVTAAGVVASTITGGSGNDQLTASGGTTGAVAQISTVTFVEGAGGAAIAAADSISLTVGSDTVVQVFDTDFTTTMAALEVKVEALAAYTSSVAAGVLTITAAVAGTPFTADAIFTSAGATTLTDTFATTTANVTPIGDTLIGGAGNDTLTSGVALGTMTGGAGQDLFVVGAASINADAYTTITDFTSGDLIQFAGAVGFKSAAVTLGATAAFTSFVNAAMDTLALNETGWFQFNNGTTTDTYIVMDKGGASATTFDNGTDMIVKLTGAVDLTNASFNNTHDTIAL